MNGTLLGQTKGSDKIIFLYDEKANKYGFDYNGTKYYYIFNAVSYTHLDVYKRQVYMGGSVFSSGSISTHDFMHGR